MAQANVSDSQDLKPLNILSLDGGGIRGVSELQMLEFLLQQLQITSNSETIPLPCEIFDLICGTSTGGLIALMLGRLRMGIREAMECYLNFSEKIFGHKSLFAPIRTLWGSPIYDDGILEKCFRDVVAKYAKDENALLKDPLVGDEKLCRTFVVAVLESFADSPPKLFRTYPTSRIAPEPCNIWEAARATTAAVTFFRSMKIGMPPQKYIDGALGGANNPSQLALDEIMDIFPDRQIGCFLSLGTGVPKVVKLSGSLPTIAKSCARLLSSCEMVDDAINKVFEKRAETAEDHAYPYFRFSVNRGLDTITLDEWNRVEELSAVTAGYMKYNVQQKKADKCVEVLKKRIEDIRTRQAGLDELL